MQKLVFNSDDFGISKEANRAIMLGYLSGVITSTCLMANTDAFDDAVYNVLPKIADIGVGVHLNALEGKSLTNSPLLTDSSGFFNKGFCEILYNSNDKNFLNALEYEFRAQIEKILNHTKIDHLNSHIHIHAIPSVFELVCKLCKEYDIQFIRTQYEKPYIIPDLFKHLSVKYPVNLIKLALLNLFSLHNKKTVLKYGLKTNKYLIGVTYTGYMDTNTVLYALKSISKKDDESIAEVIIHPWCDKKNPARLNNYNEFLITQNKDIKEKIINLGFDFVNYKTVYQRTIAEKQKQL